jgi:hypothetical protein
MVDAMMPEIITKINSRVWEGRYGPRRERKNHMITSGRTNENIA